MKKLQANIVCDQVNIPSPCPKKWKNLAVTSIKRQRLCDSCGEIVYLCFTEKQSIENTRRGRCIALPEDGIPTETPEWMKMTIGRGEIEE